MEVGCGGMRQGPLTLPRCQPWPMPSATITSHVAKRRYEALLAFHAAAEVDGQRDMARLRSCAGQASAVWLTVLPTARSLVHKSEQFCTGMQHRPGLAPLPTNAIGLPCSCRVHITQADGAHAMVCTSVRGQLTMRHDLLKGIVRRVFHRAGVASTMEPTLCRLPGLQAGVTAPAGGGGITRLAGRGGVLLALEREWRL
jgi:hypothetical protein